MKKLFYILIIVFTLVIMSGLLPDSYPQLVDFESGTSIFHGIDMGGNWQGSFLSINAQNHHQFQQSPKTYNQLHFDEYRDQLIFASDLHDDLIVEGEVVKGSGSAYSANLFFTSNSQVVQLVGDLEETSWGGVGSPTIWHNLTTGEKLTREALDFRPIQIENHILVKSWYEASETLEFVRKLEVIELDTLDVVAEYHFISEHPVNGEVFIAGDALMYLHDEQLYHLGGEGVKDVLAIDETLNQLLLATSSVTFLNTTPQFGYYLLTLVDGLMLLRIDADGVSEAIILNELQNWQDFVVIDSELERLTNQRTVFMTAVETQSGKQQLLQLNFDVSGNIVSHQAIDEPNQLASLYKNNVVLIP